MTTWTDRVRAWWHSRRRPTLADLHLIVRESERVERDLEERLAVLDRERQYWTMRRDAQRDDDAHHDGH